MEHSHTLNILRRGAYIHQLKSTLDAIQSAQDVGHGMMLDAFLEQFFFQTGVRVESYESAKNIYSIIIDELRT